MKAILLPHFAVQIVTASALATQSWSNSCALLIIPGGRDVPYVTSLAAATPAIRSYVENGGAFLGICAGAYFASRRVEWEMGSKLEVSGDRPLCFFDGVCKGSVYPGFVYESENGARAIAVEDVEGVEIVRGIYHNGGGEFVDVESSRAAEVFAKYVEGEGQGKIAAVRCRVGKGIAILWGAHPEYPLTQEPLLSALKKRESPLSDEGREVIEQQRWKLLRKTITTLGLHLPSDNQESNKSTASPLPQFLTSSISPLPTRILNLLAAHATSTEPQALQDSNDTFLLHPSPSATSILRQARDRVASETNMQLSKDILFYENGELPPAELTPKFSTRQYYSHLSSIRTSHGSSSPGPDKWGLGQLLLYGETVTSTQSMLDRYVSPPRISNASIAYLITYYPTETLYFSALFQLRYFRWPLNSSWGAVEVPIPGFLQRDVSNSLFSFGPNSLRSQLLAWCLSNTCLVLQLWKPAGNSWARAESAFALNGRMIFSRLWT